MRRAAVLALLLASAAADDDRIRELVSQLSSGKEEERAGAAKRLGALGPRAKSAVPALAKALGDESAWVAGLASAAIQRIGPDSVPALVKALSSRDGAARTGAMRLLDESFARDLQPYLRTVASLLKDEEAGARAHAAHALGQQGEPAIGLLLPLLGTRDARARDAAIAGLVTVGGAAVEPLLRALATGSEPVRAGAAAALGELKAEGAAEQLLSALSEKSPDVTAAAARALGRIGARPDEVLPRLLEGLRDASPAVRDACIDALSAYGERAKPQLIAALESAEVRAAASAAFLRMDARGPTMLREILDEGGPAVRCAALAALGGFNPALIPDETIRAAGLCLRDENVAVRAAAVSALARIGPRGKDDLIKVSLAHDDAALRAAAFHALGELGIDPGREDDPEPAVRVEALLANWKIRGGAGGEELRRIAFDASADASVRAAAVAAIGEMGLAAEGVDLLPLLESDRADIRRAVAGALGSVTQPSAQAIRELRAGVKLAPEVTAGLDWLAKAQGAEGEWPARLFTSGVSGLSLLAFFAAGCGPQDERYGTVVRRGLAHLVKSQDKRGILGTTASHSYAICHAIAATALVEAWILSGEYRYRRAAQWALDHSAAARNPGLAWRYDPRGGENDTHVTTWQLTALMLGDAAGLRVDRDAYAGATVWIERVTEGSGRTGYDTRGSMPARPEELVESYAAERVETMTAAALWCRGMLGGECVKTPLYRKGVGLVLAKEPQWRPGYQDMIYWYFGALALFQEGDAAYRKWEKPLVAALMAGRNGTSGAWRTDDVWCGSIPEGPESYVTAVGVLTLLTPTRYPRDFMTKPKLSAATRATIAALRKAQSDPDAQVREIAAAACARLGG